MTVRFIPTLTLGGAKRKGRDQWSGPGPAARGWRSCVRPPARDGLRPHPLGYRAVAAPRLVRRQGAADGEIYAPRTAAHKAVMYAMRVEVPTARTDSVACGIRPAPLRNDMADVRRTMPALRRWRDTLRTDMPARAEVVPHIADGRART